MEAAGMKRGLVILGKVNGPEGDKVCELHLVAGPTPSGHFRFDVRDVREDIGDNRDAYTGPAENRRVVHVKPEEIGAEGAYQLAG